MMFMDSKMMEMARELFGNSRDLTFEESQAIRSYYHKRYSKPSYAKTLRYGLSSVAFYSEYHIMNSPYQWVLWVMESKVRWSVWE